MLVADKNDAAAVGVVDRLGARLLELLAIAC
jgi:hypothetical protein